jgi:alkanesulfonate monooxygenase SsuD/methylene tetrahydromethanopterin reductase-like flavin-dependent oxidoreductase (luciferase family)
VWKAKNEVLDAWCEKEGREPKSITRTANVGFYMAADERGVKRQEQKLREHWGDESEQTGGSLRGTPAQAFEMVQAYREAGVQRLNIALREGPYDWEALEVFADLAGLTPPPAQS